MLTVWVLWSKEYGYETPFYASEAGAQVAMERLSNLRAYQGLLLVVKEVEIVY